MNKAYKTIAIVLCSTFLLVVPAKAFFPVMNFQEMFPITKDVKETKNSFNNLQEQLNNLRETLNRIGASVVAISSLAAELGIPGVADIAEKALNTVALAMNTLNTVQASIAITDTVISDIEKKTADLEKAANNALSSYNDVVNAYESAVNGEYQSGENSETLSLDSILNSYNSTANTEEYNSKTNSLLNKGKSILGRGKATANVDNNISPQTEEISENEGEIEEEEEEEEIIEEGNYVEKETPISKIKKQIEKVRAENKQAQTEIMDKLSSIETNVYRNMLEVIARVKDVQRLLSQDTTYPEIFVKKMDVELKILENDCNTLSDELEETIGNIKEKSRVYFQERVLDGLTNYEKALDGYMKGVVSADELYNAKQEYQKGLKSIGLAGLREKLNQQIKEVSRLSNRLEIISDKIKEAPKTAEN